MSLIRQKMAYFVSVLSHKIRRLLWAVLFDAKQLLCPFILQNTQPQDRDANI